MANVSNELAIVGDSAFIGAVISAAVLGQISGDLNLPGWLWPLLANIYLHYCMDLWINPWRKRQTPGDVIVVRYADDAVLGFQRKDDAEAFLSQLHQRLDRFGL